MPITQKQIDKLLQPRYLVVLDYPDSTKPIGTIIEIKTEGRSKEWIENHCSFYDKYPHLFQILMWWEHRKDSDLPEYLSVSGKGGGFVFKITSFEEYYNDAANIPHWSYVFKGVNIWNEDIDVPAIFTNPATEQQYNDYIISQSSVLNDYKTKNSIEEGGS